MSGFQECGSGRLIRGLTGRTRTMTTTNRGGRRMKAIGIMKIMATTMTTIMTTTIITTTTMIASRD